MFLPLNRLLTTEEVRGLYGVPDDLAPKLLPLMPVFAIRADGTRIHLESEIDDFLAKIARSQRLGEARAKRADAGRPGRKVTTQEVAVFADELKRAGKSWKEILRACRQQWPDDPRVKDHETVRATWRRHFRPRRGNAD